MKKSQANFALCSDLLGSVASMFDSRDTYTDGHSQRIAQMAANFCRVLKLSASDTNNIILAASIHDIGNLGIPPAVLNKNQQLSSEEWAIICEHPNIGADLVEKFDGLRDVALIVRHHHERWNGLGYPSRLKEGKIPMGARILSILESIDAMLSYRPYRKTMLVTDCKADIEKNAGVMYDPRLAKTLLENWENIISPISFI